MQATAPRLARAGTAMPDGAPRHHADPLHGLDVAVESAVGADVRLLYGFLVPILLVCGLIIVLALSPSYWLVAAALVPEIALLFFMVTKILAMLNEPDRSETSGPPR